MTPWSSRQAPIAAPLPDTPSPIRLGLGANSRQFTLLVVVNAFVGAMVGLERTVVPLVAQADLDRKSTRLNSSHSQISYAVFCLKKKNSAPPDVYQQLFRQRG